MACRAEKVREVVVWDDLFTCRGPLNGMTALVNYASREKLINPNLGVAEASKLISRNNTST